MNATQIELLQAFRDLIAQGSYGISSDSHAPGCQYLTSEGKSCIVGLWAKRNRPNVPLKTLHGSVDDDDFNGPATRLRLTTHEVQLFSVAQQVHDQAAIAGKPLTKENLLTVLNHTIMVPENEKKLIREVLDAL